MKEIVIKIPDKVYDYVKREWIESDFDSPLNHVMNGVKNGTPLPEDFSLEDYERYKKDSESLSWMKYPDRMGN